MNGTHPILESIWQPLLTVSGQRQRDEKTKGVPFHVAGVAIVMALALVERSSFSRSPGVAEFVIATRCLKNACKFVCDSGNAY